MANQIGNKIKKNIGVILVFFVLCIYSFLFASQLSLEFQNIKSLDLYKLSANGWSEGTLELRLEDGTFPISREGRINIDNSVYKGKAYSYYAPLPILLHFILNNLLSLDITSIAQVWLTGLLTLVIAYLISQKIISNLFVSNKALSQLTTIIFIAALGSSSIYLHSTSIGFASYQSTVSSQFFIVLSIYFFIDSLIYGVNKKGLALSSLSIVAAFFCRHHFIIVTPIYLIFIYIISSKQPISQRIQNISVFAIPIFIGFFLLLFWNFLLFEEPFETGITWMNSHVFNGARIFNARPDLHRIPDNIYSYFLNGFELHNTVPALQALQPQVKPGVILHRYPIFSLFISCPLILLGIISFLIMNFFTAQKSYKIKLVSLFLLLVGGSLFSIDLTADSAWVRYLYDAYYAWAFVALIGIYQALNSLKILGNNFRWPYFGFILFIFSLLLWQFFVGFDQTLALVTRDDQMIYNWAYQFNPDGQALLKKVDSFYSIFNR